MPASLISLDGHPHIILEGLLTLVGRGECCDAQVRSSRVSRRHCCVAIDAEHAVVRDLGSINGTWINGRRVEGGPLRPGDELWIAHRVYRFELGTCAPVEHAATSEAEESAGGPSPPTCPEMARIVTRPGCESTA